MVWAWLSYRPFFRRRTEAAAPDALERPPAPDQVARAVTS
jgi:hypothetical protein